MTALLPVASGPWTIRFRAGAARGCTKVAKVRICGSRQGKDWARVVRRSEGREKKDSGVVVVAMVVADGYTTLYAPIMFMTSICR